MTFTFLTSVSQSTGNIKDILEYSPPFIVSFLFQLYQLLAEEKTEVVVVFSALENRKTNDRNTVGAESLCRCRWKVRYLRPLDV